MPYHAMEKMMSETETIVERRMSTMPSIAQCDEYQAILEGIAQRLYEPQTMLQTALSGSSADCATAFATVFPCLQQCAAVLQSFVPFRQEWLSPDSLYFMPMVERQARAMAFDAIVTRDIIHAETMAQVDADEGAVTALFLAIRGMASLISTLLSAVVSVRLNIEWEHEAHEQSHRPGTLHPENAP